MPTASQAREKGTKLIDEDGLFSLIKASLPFVKEEEGIEDQAAARGGAARGGSVASQPPSVAGLNKPTSAIVALPSAGFYGGSGGAGGSGSSRQQALGQGQRGATTAGQCSTMLLCCTLLPCILYIF